MIGEVSRLFHMKSDWIHLQTSQVTYRKKHFFYNIFTMHQEITEQMAATSLSVKPLIL